MKHRNLPIDKVQVPPVRVTSYFDSEVYAQFQKTVAQVGVLEPVVVVEVGEEFFLVDGLHRLVEAKESGAQEIAAVVIPGDDKDVLLTNLFLNVLRGKPRVKEMREVVEVLHESYKIGVAQICAKTGLSQGFVEDFLTVSRLPEEVLEAFDDGRLAKGKALALCRLPTPELQLKVFYHIDGRNLSVEDVEEIVALVLEEQGKAPAPPRNPAEPGVMKRVCDYCHEESPIDKFEKITVCPLCLKDLLKLGSYSRSSRDFLKE